MKIQCRAAQILRALIIDEKLYTIVLHHVVSSSFLIERHFVVHPRATALCDVHAQAFASPLALLLEQSAKLSRSVLGDVNHLTKTTVRRSPSQSRC